MSASKSIRVSPEIWQRAKIQAAKDDLTLQLATERALERWLGEREQIRVVPTQWPAERT